MRKTLAVVATTAALTFTGVASASAATTSSVPSNRVTVENTENDDNQDKTGLWGLLGLLGLAGLMRRKDDDRTTGSR